MIVQGVNNTAGILSYPNESVTIAANSTVTFANNILASLFSDPLFLNDIDSGNISLSDSVNTYSGTGANIFLKKVIELNRFDKTGSGSITGGTGTVVANVSGCSSVSFSVTGTFVGTILFQAQNGDGNWKNINAQFQPNGSIGQYSTLPCLVTIPCGSFTQIRVSWFAYTSGTAVINWNAGSGTNSHYAISLLASGFLTSSWNFDGAGNAVGSTLGSDGVYRLGTASSPIDGQKATYSANVTGLVPAIAATDVFTLTGSATKTIRVTKVGLSGTQTTAGPINIQLIKRSTANSAGTSAAASAMPHDSNSAAATATALSYTANPTLGTVIGTMRSSKLFLPTVTGAPQFLEWLLGSGPAQAVVLRGVSQVLAINLNGATLAGSGFDFYIEWTEE